MQQGQWGTRTRFCLLSLLALCFLAAATFVAGAKAPAAVGDDGYSVPASISPAAGCRGSQVSISGTGADPHARVSVYLKPGGAPNSIGGGVAHLGETISDGSGDWSLTAAVPNEVSVPSPDFHYPLEAGSWTVIFDGIDETGWPGDFGERAAGSFEVLDCDVLGASRLPSTGTGGVRLAIVLLAAGAALMTVMVCGRLKSGGRGPG